MSSAARPRAGVLSPVKPKAIFCTRCLRSSPQQHCPAAIACLACAAYQCQRCDALTHSAGDAQAHVRYPVANLKAYIDFDAPKKPGESHPRSHLASHGKPIALSFDGCHTPYETFWRSVRLYGNKPCLGARGVTPEGKIGAYEWQNYRQVGDRVLNLAAAMRAWDLEANARVGLYSVNRPEWIIAEQACFANNLITVPLYDTLGPDAAELIIQQATLSVVVCSIDKVASLVTIASKHPSLKHIIVMPTQAFDSQATKTQVLPPSTPALRIVPFVEAERAGSAVVKSFKPTPPTPKDYATFCYTSGTTGLPKGAMLTHGTIISDMAAVTVHGDIIGFDEHHISYLPAAHMFERLTLCQILAHGGATGFSRGNALLLLEDIETLRPTSFCGVPRLYNRLYDKVLAAVESGSPVKRWLFHTAYNQKLAALRATGTVTHPLWDRLVFKPIAAKLGGRCRLMVTGSAPIADNVLQFLRICFSCRVIEGYGQTESTAASTLTLPGDDRSFGNVGTPLLSNLVKLVDVPEMKYTSTDVVNGFPAPRGEVCFKGPSVFSGYFQDPEKTAEAIDADGWLHSGDIGMWLPNQSLKLIDRKKNIFKTAQGEYVAPEKIENVYQRCRFVAQSFVHGDSLESTLVAVIVPDEEELTAWAKSKGIAFRQFSELVAHPLVKPLILGEMAQIARDAQLKGFEQVKTVHLTHVPFSAENGLLTPTFKLKRNIAAEVFAKEIEQMYGKGGKVEGAQIKSKL